MVIKGIIFDLDGVPTASIIWAGRKSPMKGAFISMEPSIIAFGEYLGWIRWKSFWRIITANRCP